MESCFYVGRVQSRRLDETKQLVDWLKWINWKDDNLAWIMGKINKFLIIECNKKQLKHEVEPNQLVFALYMFSSDESF